MPKQTRETGEWRVFENAEMLAEHIAEWLCGLAQTYDRDFAVCLSGGSTPRRFYRQLAHNPLAARFPWKHAHWFWGDERFVQHDSPESNFRMAYDALLSHVPVANERIHAIPTEGLSPEEAAASYQTLLQRFYGTSELDPARPIFDVTLLGIGEDGHTASLFPGSPSLKEDRRWVLPVVGEGRETRITLTFPALDSSRNLAFLATGADKKHVLARIHAGDAELPAARVRPAGYLYWFLDRAAAPIMLDI
jgi:6-phosphogluconolactonase